MKRLVKFLGTSSTVLAISLATTSAMAFIPPTPHGLIKQVQDGSLKHSMTERGYIYTKTLPRQCGWSNHDAEYRARSLARKLEHLIGKVNDGVASNEYPQAELLANTINKSTMYQKCWQSMTAERVISVPIYPVPSFPFRGHNVN